MIGNEVLFFESLSQTNQYMKDHIDLFSPGDIVLAERQTHGRGRRNRTWISIKGNLHASLYMAASHFNTPFAAVVFTSLAIQRSLLKWNVQSLIKYPNDIIVNNYKIAGILIERKNDTLVIGFGVNIVFSDHDVYDFNPGSIYRFSGETIDYRDVLQEIIRQMNILLQYSEEERFLEYKNKSLVIGKEIHYENELWTVASITASGSLIINKGAVEREISDNEITLKEV